MKSNYLLVLFYLLNLSGLFASGQIDSLDEKNNLSNFKNETDVSNTTASISPSSSWILPDILKENSGLIFWDERLWTFNDDLDTNLYAFSTENISNYQKYPLSGIKNVNWEEVAQDNEYVYIGDFGNNVNGNRTDLKILRILKSSLLDALPKIDTIKYSYSQQTDFSPQGSDNTDFDCESFIVSKDSIYLFTKEWVSEKTSLYSMPKQAGSYIAKFQGSSDVQGLITGATYLESKNLIVLCGYSKLVQPFLILLYDFKDYQFFSGIKRKVSINLPFYQVEGIATENGLKYYLSNEYLSELIITTDQSLHLVDLSAYLSEYLSTLNSNSIYRAPKKVEIFPNPAKDFINVKVNEASVGKVYSITDTMGRVIINGICNDQNFQIDTSSLSKGLYLVGIVGDSGLFTKIIKE